MRACVVVFVQAFTSSILLLDYMRHTRVDAVLSPAGPTWVTAMAALTASAAHAPPPSLPTPLGAAAAAASTASTGEPASETPQVCVRVWLRGVTGRGCG